jgi:beta-ribofuranosylaminobenzene 5'-phosphate synthase
MRGVKLRAFPRLHFGLTDMSGATKRSYGGVGASFGGPSLLVEGRPAGNLTTEFDDLDRQSAAVVHDAVAAAAASGLTVHGRVALVAQIPAHVGLGSTTATTLAVLMTLSELNDWHLPPHRLIEISGRARTSAVGSHTFFHGGLVADVGQRAPGPTDQYLPSLEPAGRPPSLKLGHWSMPTHWYVWLSFADGQPSVPPEHEAAFFASATPTSRSDTLHQLAALYHGIVPAALESDISRFASALREFQQLGFKAREIAAQPASIQSMLTSLWTHGAAAGLSSLGPTLFVITDSPARTELPVSIRSTRIAGPFAFNNDGYVLS